MNDVAVAVAEDLELDVARVLHVAFQQHRSVAEGGLRHALRGGQRLGELGVRAHDLHALAAATGRGLDDQRIADGMRLFGEVGVVLLVAVVAGHQRHGVLGHQLLGGGLGAHRLDALRIGADEHDAGVLAGARKGRVLGEEAVAGMDRLRAALFRSVEDGVDAQIGLGRQRAANRQGLVGLPHVLCVAVGFRVHRDGADTEATAGADHAAGDFTAVGDQYTFEHAISLARRSVQSLQKLADARCFSAARRSKGVIRLPSNRAHPRGVRGGGSGPACRRRRRRTWPSRGIHILRPATAC